MAAEGPNLGRRRFLTATTAVVGGAGGIMLAVPFVKMWLPSERAKAAGAPVEIDLSKLEDGQLLIQPWRGRPVYVFKRSEAMLATLEPEEQRLKDKDSKLAVQPSYIKGRERALKPELMVLLGVCTHLGCGPKLYADPQPEDFDAKWQGGFFCPCHNSRFDLAGRVYTGSPAATNLEIPSYSFIDDDKKVLIGVDPVQAA
jgi:ubiquinol-cytochrome c reductase iron-sulfur subunit